jgi:hypothetical protein
MHIALPRQAALAIAPQSLRAAPVRDSWANERLRRGPA